MNKLQSDKKFHQLSLILVVVLLITASLACLSPVEVVPNTGQQQPDQPPAASQAAQVQATRPGSVATQAVLPTLPASQATVTIPQEGGDAPVPGVGSSTLVELHNQLAPGVVNIQTYMTQMGQTGQGAGSGFVLDEAGHIVTNNHVVSGANRVVVVFFNNIEADAEVIGTDDDSDLAVVKVSQLPDGVHPIPLGDSNSVQVGEWVIAIGNPFGLGSSMTIGIVSAVGRTIESGVTPFSIPEAIQTDAAINPGNSGGPLLNLMGQVIGVNAQIATSGNVTTAANAGVGFAIPSNVVRKVAPVLIENGVYQWPWLGIQGGPVNLSIMQANSLPTQMGAYIDQVVPGGPAEEAGLQGSSGSEQVNGVDTPTGGDVVIAVDGEQIASFNDLMVAIASHNPGETMTLTILRNGDQTDIPVRLGERPQDFSQGDDTGFDLVP